MDVTITIWLDQNVKKIHVTAENNPSIELTMYSVSGEKVLRKQLSGSGELSVHSLPSGMYIVQLLMKDYPQIMNYKIVIP